MATRSLTGLEKAAVLLKCLPTAAVEKVFKDMSPKHARLMKSELVKIDQWPDLGELQSVILDETMAIVGDSPTASNEPAPTAKASAATPAKNEKKENIPNSGARFDLRLADKPGPEPAILKIGSPKASDPVLGLAGYPPELLALALANESARTISLLMNRLDMELAGEIYKRLAPATRKEVSMRFASSAAIPDEVFQRIVDGVMRKCQALASSSSTASGDLGGPEKRMAFLLRGLDRTERSETLTAIEGADAELAERIKGMLYVFEDILRIEKSSVQKLLSEIDTKSLATSLVGAAQDIQDKIFANLSKRAQESLKEEIELSGNVPAAKSKQAQQVIVEAIQRLDQRGELVMNE